MPEYQIENIGIEERSNLRYDRRDRHCISNQVHETKDMVGCIVRLNQQGHFAAFRFMSDGYYFIDSLRDDIMFYSPEQLTEILMDKERIDGIIIVRKGEYSRVHTCMKLDKENEEEPKNTQEELKELLKSKTPLDESTSKSAPGITPDNTVDLTDAQEDEATSSKIDNQDNKSGEEAEASNETGQGDTKEFRNEGIDDINKESKGIMKALNITLNRGNKPTEDGNGANEEGTVKHETQNPSGKQSAQLDPPIFKQGEHVIYTKNNEDTYAVIENVDHSTYPDYAYDIKVNGKDVNTIELYLRRPSKAETAEWNKNKEKTATQASAAASKEGESTFGHIAQGIRNFANSAQGALNNTLGYLERSKSSQKQQPENAQTTYPNTRAQKRKVGPTGTPLSQAEQNVVEVEEDVKTEFENLKKEIEDSGCMNGELKELNDDKLEKCIELLGDSVAKLDNKKEKFGEMYLKANGVLRSQMTNYKKNNKLTTRKAALKREKTSRIKSGTSGGARSKKKKHSKKHRKNSRKKSRSMKRIKKLKK
jgi:hypothetical protein